MIVNSIKSYNFEHDVNKFKENDVIKILFEYRRVSKIILNLQLINFYKTGQINPSNKLYKPIKTFLSERYKDVIKRQIDGMLSSWMSNIKNRFIEIVLNCSLSKKEKNTLYKINRENKWFEKDNFLARKVIKGILNKWKYHM